MSEARDLIHIYHLEREVKQLRELSAELVQVIEELLARHDSGGATAAADEWRRARDVVAKADARET